MNKMLGESLTDADSEAVGAELEQMEQALLDEEVASMPNMPVSTRT